MPNKPNRKKRLRLVKPPEELAPEQPTNVIPFPEPWVPPLDPETQRLVNIEKRRGRVLDVGSDAYKKEQSMIERLLERAKKAIKDLEEKEDPDDR